MSTPQKKAMGRRTTAKAEVAGMAGTYDARPVPTGDAEPMRKTTIKLPKTMHTKLLMLKAETGKSLEVLVAEALHQVYGTK